MQTYCVAVMLYLVVLLDARLIVNEYAVAPKQQKDMYNCYLRYVSEPVVKGVIIYHANPTNMTEYIEPIQSTRVVINVMADHTHMRDFDISSALIIIVVTDIGNVEYLFRLLAEYPSAQVRAQHLVIYLGEEPTDKIFELAWRWYIVNIVVLRQGDTSVYTYFPYGHGECGERIQSVVLGQCQQLSLAALYPAKVPNVFHGCTFRINTHSSAPGIFDPWANTGYPLIDGYENIMVNSIVERLNLSKQLNVSVLKEIVHANGSVSFWTPLDNLSLNISDMCFAGYMRISKPGLLIEASYVYEIDTMVWHAPVAGPGAQWMSVILVFQGSMWCAVLGFFLLNTFVWWIFGRKTNYRHGSYLECLLGSLLILLNGSVPFPKRTVMRFLMASWMVCSLLVIAAYQCQFLSFLLKPVYEKQITNEREILESRVPVILWAGQIKQLMKINDQYSESILKRAQVQQISELDKSIRESMKPAVFLQSLTVTKFFGMYNYKDEKRRHTVYPFKDPIFFVPMCMYFRRGFPILDRWNSMLMQFVESGILGKLIDGVNKTPLDIPKEPEKVPINMRHLSGAIYILLFGYAAALLAFLFEQILHRMKKKIQKRSRRQR